jgi:hypothetical protein
MTRLLLLGALAAATPQAPASLVEQALKNPAQTEATARKMTAADPASATWVILLAKSQAAQGRCGEAARELVAARPRVDTSQQLLLGMSMTELSLQCEAIPIAEARPLLETASAIAEAILAVTPDNRDAVMLQTAALMGLAQRLAQGPERAELEARSSTAFDRFRALNPDRRRALAGEPLADLARSFEFVREFLEEGRTAEATRLQTNIEKVHGGSPEFRIESAKHHARLAATYLDRASAETTARADRPGLLRAGQTEVDRAFALDPRSTDAMMSRSMLLRAQADLEPDARRKAALLEEADAWLDKAGLTPPPPPPPARKPPRLF